VGDKLKNMCGDDAGSAGLARIKTVSQVHSAAPLS
jgi:hypothetical protein